MAASDSLLQSYLDNALKTLDTFEKAVTVFRSAVCEDLRAIKSGEISLDRIEVNEANDGYTILGVQRMPADQFLVTDSGDCKEASDGNSTDDPDSGASPEEGA